MKYLFYSLIIAIFLSCNSSSTATAPNEMVTKGEELFTSNCSNCHKPNEDFVGPALKGAESRWKDKETLYEFVKNPATVIQKDNYAISLQKKFGSVMIAFPNLSNNDIDAILAYCNK